MQTMQYSQIAVCSYSLLIMHFSRTAFPTAALFDFATNFQEKRSSEEKWNAILIE